MGGPEKSRKLYGKHSFPKKFKINFFCHQSVQLFSKNPRNGLIFFLFFFENVWKLYDKHFLHTLNVWICMIMICCCMELYDKHFRCMEVNPGNLQDEFARWLNLQDDCKLPLRVPLNLNLVSLVVSLRQLSDFFLKFFCNLLRGGA